MTIIHLDTADAAWAGVLRRVLTHWRSGTQLGSGATKQQQEG